MNRSQNQGFTLIEIAIVLVIIGLLLGVFSMAIPAAFLLDWFLEPASSFRRC